MKSSSDHRTRVTKMLIRKAFTELLRHKPIHHISVKELCETAGISRGTFYCHYSDMFDLRKQMEDEMFLDFKKALEPVLAADHGKLTLVNAATGVFQCLKDNADLCTVTLGEYGDKAFAFRLIHFGREKCVETYPRIFASATPKQIEFYYSFVSAGCIGLLQKWLAEGMTYTPKEMATMAVNLMMYGMGALKPEP